jgi:cytochrome b561
MTTTTSTRYDTVSRVFHWLTAFAVIAAFILGPEHFGRLMHQGLDPATRLDIVWHESLGVAIFVLTLLRLLWVAIRPAAPVVDMAGWMKIASKGGHFLLWVLMLIAPLSAFLALGTEGHPVTLLGNVRIDELPWVKALPIADAADWGEVHGFLGDVIIWLAGLHAVAALYHHYILKDSVLMSMLPASKK